MCGGELQDRPEAQAREACAMAPAGDTALQPTTIANRRWRRVAEMARQVQAEPGPHVPSPCQSVCVMHPETGWCEGCLRTIGEIADWSRMDNATKQQVWAQLPARLQQRIALEND